MDTPAEDHTTDNGNTDAAGPTKNSENIPTIAIIEQIKSRLGGNRQSGSELQFPTCPFCGDDGSHFYINSLTLKFFCHKCGKGGGRYALLKETGIRIGESPEEGKYQKHLLVV